MNRCIMTDSFRKCVSDHLLVSTGVDSKNGMDADESL